MAKRGLFISVEGIDGAGKSTHVEFIKNYLIQAGKEVVTTREPGGTAVGEKIREILLHKNMHVITELLLMFASRQELIKDVIAPNLSAGKCVITDRFIDASIAYQGAGRGIGVSKVKEMAKLMEPHLTTDLTILFDVPLEVAMARLNKHNNKDRIESEDYAFFERVRGAYYRLAQEDPVRVKIIRTDRSIADTREMVIKCLDNLLKKNG